MEEAGRRTTPAGWSVRWDPARAQAAYAEGWWREETAADALARIATAYPERVLIADDAGEVTAADLHAEAGRLAQALRRRFPQGGVVSFMLPNWREAASVYFATLMAGMTAHPVPPSLRDHDLGFMLADVGSRIVFIPGQWRGCDYPAMLQRVSAGLQHGPDIVVLRGEAEAGALELEALLAEAPVGEAAPLPALDPDEVAMAMYTSGSTGRSKGVLHTHNSLHALLRQIGLHWRVAPGDRFLVPSPISHIGGSIYAFEAPVLLGSTAVLMERWDAQAGLRQMIERGCTHMAGATPFLQGLVDAAEAAGERLPQLKVFICGGASVPPALIRRAQAQFPGAVVSRVYGSTEAPVTTVGVMDPADAAEAAETDGRPGVAQVRIAADGEIRVQGPQMLAGYLRREDEATAFEADGFYRSGDQGRWSAGGALVVTGRIKDLIIRNGENISPKEIEDLLSTHPAIAEAAVVGVPDPRTGERAVAVLVAAGDGPAPGVAELAAFLDRLGVARFKFPEGVALRDALPRNDAGKVLKHRLRAELAQA